MVSSKFLISLSIDNMKGSKGRRKEGRNRGRKKERKKERRKKRKKQRKLHHGGTNHKVP